MTTPYLTGLVKVQAQFKDSEGRVDECVSYWLQAGSAALTLAQLEAIRNAYDAAVVLVPSTQLSWLAGTCHYIGSIVTDQQSNTGLSAGNSGYTPFAGTGGNQTGRQISALISLVTNLRYRGGHGRMYLPCIASGVVSTDGQTIPSGTITDIDAWITQIGTAMAAVAAPEGPLNQVILHSRQQVIPHTVPPTYKPAFTTPIANYVVQSIIATQRRRLRKVAHH